MYHLHNIRYMYEVSITFPELHTNVHIVTDVCRGSSEGFLKSVYFKCSGNSNVL